MGFFYCSKHTCGGVGQCGLCKRDREARERVAAILEKHTLLWWADEPVCRCGLELSGTIAEHQADCLAVEK